MPIQRSGPVPPFYEYVTSKALIPHNGSDVSTLIDLGIHEWIEIPRYQRGISWEIDNVEEFLESPSILLGNVILAQFPHEGQFSNLRSPNYLILVDGLQRFSVGTMILSILHEKVFSSGSAAHSSCSRYFTGLIARVLSLSAVYLHNDYEFLNHPRMAIQTQYRLLKEKVENYISQQLIRDNGERLSRLVHSTYLNRQVALDIYFNFNGPIEIMSTFLGINTVRVDLGPVDLLRALIVEQGASAGWSATDIDEIENDFTGIFTNNDKPDTSLLPFVNVILKSLNESPTRVFPTWGRDLLISDVNNFLDFVEYFKSPTGFNGYLQEIKDCGSIPLAILISHYYIQFIHYDLPKPSFLEGGTCEDEDLKSLLISSYRVLLDGTIGRSRIYAERIISGTQVGTLTDIANQISVHFINRSISESADLNWLLACLNKVDKNKAKRIFNAMLLPNRGQGTDYTPLVFGRSSASFHIDHLIPQSLIGSLNEEGESLRNFAPLPQNQNRVAKATSCSSKLGPQGIYINYIQSNTHQVHPYCLWLVEEFTNYNQSSQLDQIELLEPNRTPDIGGRRINYISSQLIMKI
ncbi:hypothetical protein J2T16_005268 [Paenibacillus intestini]|nr:hypothetical protein [Paenibacillus intestini]